MFETNCHLLNTKQYTGKRRLQVRGTTTKHAAPQHVTTLRLHAPMVSQVELWLLFEDQTSSIYAKITQISLLGLIVFSTVLILVQSHTTCIFVLGCVWHQINLPLIGWHLKLTSPAYNRSRSGWIIIITAPLTAVGSTSSSSAQISPGLCFPSTLSESNQSCCWLARLRSPCFSLARYPPFPERVHAHACTRTCPSARTCACNMRTCACRLMCTCVFLHQP